MPFSVSFTYDLSTHLAAKYYSLFLCLTSNTLDDAPLPSVYNGV